MTAHFPDIPWGRYADDALYHCRSEAQARSAPRSAGGAASGMQAGTAPAKDVRRVYGKDADRRGSYPEQAFDLLSLYLSAPKGEALCGAAVHQLRAGSQRPSGPSDAPTGASLAVASSHRSRLGRYRAVGSARGTGRGPMLREVLPVRASRATRARWITTWRAWGCDSRVLLTYLHAWETGAEAKAALARYFAF
jgi:hypothetical protein